MITEKRALDILVCLQHINETGPKAEQALDLIFTDKQTTLSEHYEQSQQLLDQICETMDDLEEIRAILWRALQNKQWKDNK